MRQRPQMQMETKQIRKNSWLTVSRVEGSDIFHCSINSKHFVQCEGVPKYALPHIEELKAQMIEED